MYGYRKTICTTGNFRKSILKKYPAGRKYTGKIKSITFASAEDTEFSFIFFFMSSCLCVLKLFSYEKNIFIVYWTTI